MKAILFLVIVFTIFVMQILSQSAKPPDPITYRTTIVGSSPTQPNVKKQPKIKDSIIKCFISPSNLECFVKNCETGNFEKHSVFFYCKD
jgi:hypothetical protein